MGCSIGWGGVVFEEAGDADVKVWEGEDLLLPGTVAAAGRVQGPAVGNDYFPKET